MFIPRRDIHILDYVGRGRDQAGDLAGARLLPRGTELDQPERNVLTTESRSNK